MLKDPLIVEVARDSYMIDLMGMQSPTLLVGAERALLIDTGLGNVDMMSVVRRVTDKPVTLVLTHAHSDHMGGVCQFPEVYVHPADLPAARQFAETHLFREGDPPVTQAQFLAHVKEEWEAKPGNIFEIPGEMVEGAFPAPVFRPLRPGQLIDLGGRQVQVLEERGHTAGEIALLDFQSRILFSGDGISTCLSVTATPVETAYCDLLAIKARQDSFDRIYDGHFAALDVTTLCSHPTDLLDAMLEILADALSGADPGQPAGMGSPTLRTRALRGVQLFWYADKLR